MKQCIPLFDIFITGVMAFVFHPLESQYKQKLSLYRIKLNKMGYEKTINNKKTI